jgi:alpha-L-fucosidase
MIQKRSLLSISLGFSLIWSLLLPARSAVQKAGAEKPYTPAPENLQARRWFQDAKFGLFIHWGVYSVPGGEYKGQNVKGIAEWIMHSLKIPIPEYEQFASQFNPTEFDPAEWVRLAKQAGMKYITITSKHHDGFAMWDSKVSDWDIVDRTPYKKDVLKMLADECHKQGIKLFFYYSHLDWHHPDYFPRGRTGQYAGRPESGDFNKYLDYLDAQLTELLSGHYGKIAGIWFDGWWDQQIKEPGGDPRRSRVDWRLRQTYDLIHKLQPQALVGNNHHLLPFEGEDFQMFEKDLPGQNTAGFNENAKIGELPLEMCETTNDSWGYKKSDKNFKSLKQLVHLLLGAAGRNSNFLLNIGPMPNGKFPPEAIKQLTEIGRWMKQYGDAIYGTRGGPLAPQPWGVTTHKGDRVYVHLLDSEAAHGEEIALAGLNAKVKKAYLLKDGSKVRFDATKNALVIPKSSRDAIDTVVVLELAQ